MNNTQFKPQDIALSIDALKGEVDVLKSQASELESVHETLTSMQAENTQLRTLIDQMKNEFCHIMDEVQRISREKLAPRLLAIYGKDFDKVAPAPAAKPVPPEKK